MSSDQSSPDGEVPIAAAESEREEPHLFLSPDAVPRRKNQMMAAGLAVVAVVILAVAVALTLLIHYDNLPSLFSYFS